MSDSYDGIDQRAGGAQGEPLDTDRDDQRQSVGEGLAKSLAQPGGNVTGLTVMLSDLSSKRLEILKDTLPKMTRVAVLSTPQNLNPA